jgi:DNA-binding protein H-NS
MKVSELKSMSVDELWSLHEQVDTILSSKMEDEKRLLNQRLRLIKSRDGSHDERRPYPPVYPKYRNPTHPSETWAGRAKQPRWLKAQLRSGKKLDEFRIQTS